MLFNEIITETLSEIPDLLKLTRYFGCIFEDKNNSLHRETVNEGIFKTFLSDVVIKHLLRQFNFCFGLQNYEKSVSLKGCVLNFGDGDKKHINIVIPFSKHKSIDSRMAMCGWFLANEDYVEESFPGIVQDVPKLQGHILLQYEPLHQDTISNFQQKINIKKGYYHITPSIYLSKIKKVGLCPKHKDKMFQYPDRIYLFGNKEDFELKSEMLHAYETNKEYKGEYSCLRIDPTKCDVKIYDDPNMDGGYYTTDNIPPAAIEEIMRITINEKTFE